MNTQNKYREERCELEEELKSAPFESPDRMIVYSKLSKYIVVLHAPRAHSQQLTYFTERIRECAGGKVLARGEEKSS